MPKTTWMVRAGERAVLAADFESQSVVAIGWLENVDLSSIRSTSALKKAISEHYPDYRLSQISTAAAQIGRFLFDFKAGDRIVTYNPLNREYLVGNIVGDYEFRPGFLGEEILSPHVRKVSWLGKVSRDRLSTSTKNSLGSIMTIFKLSVAVSNELERILSAKADVEPVKPTIADESEEELDVLRKDTVEKAHEFIKDLILELDWEEMQELVAGILRAMGYKTRVSPRGADRGRDVIASPDGLGLESPRIIVEVKHRQETQISADLLRSFIGGLRPGDRGLYVSTGGYSKDAKYEADRSTIPTTLLNLDDLAQLLTEHYDSMDNYARTLVPLVRIYWPAK